MNFSNVSFSFLALSRNLDEVEKISGFRCMSQYLKLFHGKVIDFLCVLVAQSCPSLCDPADCSLPGFSVHGILQARILEWVAIPFSNGFLNIYSNAISIDIFHLTDTFKMTAVKHLEKSREGNIM